MKFQIVLYDTYDVYVEVELFDFVIVSYWFAFKNIKY